MGNAIAKKFEAPKEYTASAGHSQLWKIWPAKSKETGKDVSIWVFDKVELSKRKVNNSNATIDKAIVEQIYQIMRKDMSALREISSSSGGVGNIVQYLETIEETAVMLVFTTEPILCSLADLQSGFEGIMPSTTLDEIKRENFNGSSYDKASTVLTDIEISRGLLNISEGLQYLHTVQRKLHLNVTPESIVITQSGQWKLCGLGFSLGFQVGEIQLLPSPYFLQSIPNLHTMRLEPDLRYCGPELTIGGLNPPGIRYLAPSSDVFSLGIVAYESYRSNLDKSISVAERRAPIIPMSNNSAVYHPTALESLSRLNYNFLPSTVLIQLVGEMIQSNPQARISIQNIMNHPYFSTGPLQVLKLIDSLKTRDIGTQSSQLLTLPSQLTDIPERLLESTILPAICQATSTTIALFPYAIPIHIYVSQRILRSKYCAIAGASVAQAFDSTSSVEVMQAILKHLNFFSEVFSSKDAQSTISIESAIVNLISNCLDKTQTSVHISGFRALCDDQIRAGISNLSLANKIVPKVCREACKNSDPNVKIHALYVLSLVTLRLDKTFIIQNILPSLKYITDHEKNPVVSMCVLGNYNVVAPVLGADYIAKYIIPSICPMLVDRSLDKKQFELVGNLMRTMLYQVYEMRANDLGLPGTGKNNIFDRDISVTELDPFYSAKIMVQNDRKDVADNVDVTHQISQINIANDVSHSTKSSSTSKYKITEVGDEPDGRLTKVSSKKVSASSSANQPPKFQADLRQQSTLSVASATLLRPEVSSRNSFSPLQQNAFPASTGYPPISAQNDPFFQSSFPPSVATLPSSYINSSSQAYAMKPTDNSLSANDGNLSPYYGSGMYSQSLNGNSNVYPSSKKVEDPFDLLS